VSEIDPLEPESPIDLLRIEKAVREILEAIGEDPDRDGLQFTPRRIADMYEEIFSGLREDPRQHVITTFEADHDEMVMVRDITITSYCEHHLVPYNGRAPGAYIPDTDGRFTGLSKRARMVSRSHVEITILRSGRRYVASTRSARP